MNITEKIEHIRKQPEHIRIRYVWGCVFISMFLIAIVWIFSAFSMFGDLHKNSGSEINTNMEELKQHLQGLQGQTKIIQELSQEQLTLPTDTKTASETIMQVPFDTVENQTVLQSNEYSNLSNTDVPRE
jgi:hypothetical protein